jgi:hypothetical protein
MPINQLILDYIDNITVGFKNTNAPKTSKTKLFYLPNFSGASALKYESGKKRKSTSSSGSIFHGLIWSNMRS